MFRTLLQDRMSVRLSVNVNKIATLRNARGKDIPHLLSMVTFMIGEGIKSITVHPRPDERHITYQDVHDIKGLLQAHPDVEYNIEGYPSEKFLHLMNEVKPTQCTLVPDPPNVITSNAGWDVQAKKDFLKPIVSKLQKLGSRVSLFIQPLELNAASMQALKEIAPDRVEFYTESYAEAWGSGKQEEIIQVYKDVAQKITSLNIGLNAGHDLNQKNLGDLIRSIPNIQEVSIGQALIAEALYDGMSQTIKKYQKILG